jgi:hypothetical protein
VRALSIRQPWAELILRGAKTIECRSRPTSVRGRIWVYAARSPATIDSLITIADAGGLQRGLVVGSVEITACRQLRPSDSAAACLKVNFDGYAWLLANPDRLEVPRAPTRHPQPVFFFPFEAA